MCSPAAVLPPPRRSRVPVPRRSAPPFPHRPRRCRPTSGQHWTTKTPWTPSVKAMGTPTASRWGLRASAWGGGGRGEFRSWQAAEGCLGRVVFTGLGAFPWGKVWRGQSCAGCRPLPFAPLAPGSHRGCASGHRGCPRNPEQVVVIVGDPAGPDPSAVRSTRALSFSAGRTPSWLD